MSVWTQAKLDELDAAILEAAISGIASYSIPGRSVVKYSLEQLQKIRQAVAAQVGEETVGCSFFLADTRE